MVLASLPLWLTEVKLHPRQLDSPDNQYFHWDTCEYSSTQAYPFRKWLTRVGRWAGCCSATTEHKIKLMWQEYLAKLISGRMFWPWVNRNIKRMERRVVAHSLSHILDLSKDNKSCEPASNIRMTNQKKSLNVFAEVTQPGTWWRSAEIMLWPEHNRTPYWHTNVLLKSQATESVQHLSRINMKCKQFSCTIIG